MGGKHRRVHGDAYFELVDEFLTAVKRRYGTSGEQAAPLRLLVSTERHGKACMHACHEQLCGLAAAACVACLSFLAALPCLPLLLYHAVLIDLTGMEYETQVQGGRVSLVYWPCLCIRLPAWMPAGLSFLPPIISLLHFVNHSVVPVPLHPTLQMKLINAYRGTFPMYSDSAFGLPTAVLGAVYAALPPGAKLAEQRFILVGGRGRGRGSA